MIVMGLGDVEAMVAEIVIVDSARQEACGSLRVVAQVGERRRTGRGFSEVTGDCDDGLTEDT